ncbi:MAG TPA: ABC transporter permease [Segetibacter sp.]|jgi:putative ABC transport system permease protein
MFKNYLKTAIRSLRKNGLFSAINIFGLALSMSVCLIALIVIKDAFTYDTFHPNGERTYRIITEVTSKDGENRRWATTALPLSEKLASDFPFVEKTARVYNIISDNAKYNSKGINVEGAFSDPAFFDLFGFELLYGDKRTALNTPYSVVLTQETSELFFKNENPVGKQLEFKTLKSTFTISGVIKKTNNKSHLQQDLYASYSTVALLESSKKIEVASNDWKNYNGANTYALLTKDASGEKLKAALSSIAAITAKNFPIKNISQISYDVQALDDITPGEELVNGGDSVSSIVLFATGGITFLILLLACFNYTNLSLARSLTRAKEVGIRKVVGGSRLQLFAQFITESILVSLISLALSYLILQVLMNFSVVEQGILNNAKPDITLLFIFILFAVLTGLLAGIIPASILSAFNPLQVLKNLTSIKLFKGLGLQKTLIVIQFAVSLIFVIILVTVFQQTKFITSFSYGFKQDNMLIVPLGAGNKDVFKAEVAKIPGVEKVAMTSTFFGYHPSGADFIKLNKEHEGMQTHLYYIDENVVPELELQLVAGQNFKVSEKQYVILNETAVKTLNFANSNAAIGKTVFINDSVQKVVSGVVKDFYYLNPRSAIGNLALLYAPEKANYLIAQVAPETKIAVASLIEQSLKQVDQSNTTSVRSLDQILSDARDTPQEFAVIVFLTVMAITIACIGLLGITTYTARVRQKEVSIRKILGANVNSIVYMLSKDFIWLLLIASAISLPLGYLLSSAFLEEFANRINLGWEMLAGSAFIILLIGLVTISSQTLRVATANPVDSLRND